MLFYARVYPITHSAGSSSSIASCASVQQLAVSIFHYKILLFGNMELVHLDNTPVSSQYNLLHTIAMPSFEEYVEK